MQKLRIRMINFILMLITIILSPVLIVCAFTSVILIGCMIYAVFVSIAEGIGKLIESIKEDE